MYKLSIKKGFTGDRRNRAGFSLQRGETLEIQELNDAQVDAIKGDPWLVLSEVKAEEPKSQTTKKMVDNQKSTKKA